MNATIKDSRDQVPGWNLWVEHANGWWQVVHADGAALGGKYPSREHALSAIAVLTDTSGT